MNGHQSKPSDRAAFQGAVTSLPVELIMSIFDYLDRPALLACLFTCRTFHDACENMLYKIARLSKAAALEVFAHAVVANGKTALVQHLHIRGKPHYSSTLPTDWIVGVPARLAHLLPNVRTITFEFLDCVTFPLEFWTALQSFAGVRDLRLAHSSFHSSHDVHNLAFTFPLLESLSITHTRFDIYQPPVSPQPEMMLSMHNRLPNLRKLFLEQLSSMEYVATFFWFESQQSLRELGLVHIPPLLLPNAGNFLHRLANAGSTLESLTLTPLIATPNQLEHINNIASCLPYHGSLTSLHLHVVDIQDHNLRWVPIILRAAKNLALTNISLDFTLDMYQAKAMSPVFKEIVNLLQGNWRTTLRKVRLTHHPTGDLFQHRSIPEILAARFPDLVRRNVLSVHLGVAYDTTQF